MGKYDVDEKEFLLSYLSFSSKIRSRAVKKFKELIDTSESLDEKFGWCTLALEQTMLLFETFLSFYISFQKRRNSDFIETLNIDHDINGLSKALIGKSKKDVLKELDFNVELYAATPEQKEIINDRLLSLSELWQNEKLVKVFKNILIPLFNKIKHKMLIYKKDGGYAFVLETIKTEVAEKVLKEHGLENTPNKTPNPDIEIHVLFADALESWISDIIVLRLLELGVSINEIKYKESNP